MDQPLYRDDLLTITTSEIRSGSFTLYLRNVTSIGVASLQPGKWTAWLLVPMVLSMWFLNTLIPFPGISIIRIIWIPIVLLSLVIVTYSCLRITKLQVQTTGGPVLLASHLSLWKPAEALKRFDHIKRAVERGISSQKPGDP